MNHDWIIGVIGQHSCDAELYEIARQVGKGIAERGAVLLCGGLGGVMEAACRGAKQAGGFTVGILPGSSGADANPYVDLKIVTGLGEARNLVVVLSASALVACGGQAGTLSEIGFALRHGKILVGLNTWRIQDPAGKEDFFPQFQEPEAALDYVWSKLERNHAL
ncbi:MAG TPA: TIGR00725 family protein [Candidatus Atribacteria bacterium]|nr:TIGR00725 family protein [Candidatus Atribacteria bacterium]